MNDMPDSEHDGAHDDDDGVWCYPLDDAAVERATDALLANSGLPRYGNHRATVERRVRIAFDAVRGTT